MLSFRGLSLLFVATLALLCVACSGNGGIATGDPQPDPGRTLAEVLDEVDQAAVPDGVDGDVFAQLKEGLAEALAARGVSKFVSAPPTDGSSVAQPEFDAGTGDLSWRYYCTGDYNQNGLVEVADLTPLGQNYNVAGPFDETSSLSVVDGNSDGLIAVTDITPIGQNYGCQVTEYKIYGSDTEGDYPQEAGGGNGGATLLDTVAFSSAINNAGERLLFEVTVTQPLAYYWVRPSDGTTEGTPSALVMASGGVVEIDAPVLHDNLGHGSAGNLTIADGYPALLLTPHPDGGDGELQFQRALDEDGDNWCEPVTIDAPVYGWDKPSMVIVGGNPAVTYKKDNILYYCRALDAQGSAWGAPVEVFNNYNINGDMNHLMLINGNPAVACTCIDTIEQIVCYKRADDALGAGWTSIGGWIVTMPTGSRTNEMSFSVVDGKPAVAFTFEDMDIAGTAYRGVLCSVANDANGDTWPMPEVIHQIPSSENGYMQSVTLIDNSGKPAVAYMMEVYPENSDSIGWFTCSTDTAGTSWDTPDVIFGPGHSSYATGDCLKHIIVSLIEFTEGTVVAVIPVVKDSEGTQGGVLWGAPMYADTGMDWGADAQPLLEFTEPKAVGSVKAIKLPAGKQVSCFCSYVDAEMLANVKAEFVASYFLACGYPEGMAYTAAHYVMWMIPDEIFAIILSIF